MDEVAEIRAAVKFLKQGDRIAARKKLTHVLKQNPRSEMAWMWMSAAVTDREKRQQCLERTLKINPHNEKAQRVLTRLTGEADKVVLPDPFPAPVYIDIESEDKSPDITEEPVVPPLPKGAYVLDIPGFEGRTLTVRSAGFFAGYKLYINNILAPKSAGTYILKNNSGKGVEIELRSGIDPLPRVVANGKTYHIAPQFKSYEWAVCSIPMVLIGIGGALGGMAGALGMYVNGRVLRANMPGVLKFVMGLLVSGASFALYFVLAVALRMFIDMLV